MRFFVLARVAVSAVLIGLLLSQPAWAWGNDGHMMINRLAAQYLPADVPEFMRNAAALDTMQYLGPEPDRWRNRAEDELSQTQAPEHFIDMEWASYGEVPCTAPTAGCVDGKMYPRKRYDFIRALTAAQPKFAAANPTLTNVQLTPEKVGLQPWETEEVWEKLKVDFREYRKLVAAKGDTKPVELAIVYDAGWLGHYVGDGSMPLHTSIEYNGWQASVPNPNHYTTEHHIHSQFESAFVSANIKSADVAKLVAASKPKVIKDEWLAYLDYLNHSNSLVEKTYQIDKTGGFTGTGTPEAKAFTEERLAAGAIELRDMIYSAWVHSADPVEEFHG
jgi:hypothetical protein